MNRLTGPTRMNEPIACTLEAEGQAERAVALRNLFAGAERIDELPDGLAVHFDGRSESIRRIGEVVSSERECCRFLRFEMTAEPQRGPLVLKITGPPGTRAFLQTWLEG